MDQARATKRGDTEWARYLHRWMERLDWGVTKLAQNSGIARSTIQLWLAGHSKAITSTKVYVIADTVGDHRANAVKAAFAVTGNVDPRLRALNRNSRVVDLLMQLDLNNRATQTLMNLHVDDDTLEIMLKRRLEILAAREDQDVRDIVAQVEMLTRRGQGAA